MRNPQRFWDSVAKTYDERSDEKQASLLGTIENIKRHLQPEDRVLDFACGTGEKALGVADRVQSIHGIDLSPRMIEKARLKARDLTSAASFQLVESRSTAESRNHLFVVARKLPGAL
jgi:ubiquinone/menaquinone biosynthesis C-methylase UbiE